MEQILSRPIEQKGESVNEMRQTYKKKQIQLKRCNRMKYCLHCRDKVEIVMIGRDGFCPNEIFQSTGKYTNKLYTLDTRGCDHVRRQF